MPPALLRALLLPAAALLLVVPSAQAQGGFPFFPKPEHFASHPAPLHDSALLALAASVTATGALVGIGYALVDAHTPGRAREGEIDWGNVGLYLIAAGVMIGPPVGNFTLGGWHDASIALYLKAAGLTTGAVLVAVALPPGLGCITDPEGAWCSVAQGLVYAAGGVMAAGMAAGVLWDFATIPRNASRARASRQRVTLGPALTPEGAGVALRVRL